MTQKTTLQTKKIECFSMTGYAQARTEQDGWTVRVSVKSVNHRFLDLKLRMPEGFDLYDLRLRQIVREHIHRGHVEVTVGVEPGKAAPVQVNRELVLSYLKAAEALRQETRAATDMDVVALLRLPGVITGVTTAVPETQEEQERLGRLVDGGMRWQSWMKCGGRKVVTWRRSCAIAWGESADMLSRCAGSPRRCARRSHA